MGGNIKGMNKKKVKSYCLTLPLAKEDYPFGPDVQVFKIKEKLFALMTTRKGAERVNLKCDPEEAIILREIFEDVIPGYHMNKMHWNTIILSGSIPDGEIKRMIDRSYCLVVKKLKKLDRVSLEIKYGHEKVFKSNSSPWV